MSCAIYSHKMCLSHQTGPAHPESPARLHAILSLLREAPFNEFPFVEAPEASEEWLRLVHDESYIEVIKESIPATGLTALEEDTMASPDSWKAALRAAGAACLAVDDVLAGKYRRAFCAARPPGHHAEADRACGFCVLNNAAIAARYAQSQKGIRRVAIVDFDVHHGNGTQALALKADDILYISSHQHPLYPGSGRREDNMEGCLLNLPMPEGSGSHEFRALYESEGFPALRRFNPELIILSAGFDAHFEDPLAGINLTEDDFAWITERIAEIADERCQGRIVSVLEGGYDIDALRSSVAAHLLALTA